MRREAVESPDDDAVDVDSELDDDDAAASTLMHSHHHAPAHAKGIAIPPRYVALLLTLLVVSHLLAFLLGSSSPSSSPSPSTLLPPAISGLPGYTPSSTDPSPAHSPSYDACTPPLPPILLHPPMLPSPSTSSPPSSPPPSPFFSSPSFSSSPLPFIRFAYTKSGDWYRSSLQLASLHLWGRYEEVPYHPSTPNLWLVESLLDSPPTDPSSFPIPSPLPRHLGQRRLFASAEAIDYSQQLSALDYDAILDTKTTPHTHPHHLHSVYLPWYLNAFPRLGDPASLIKPSSPLALHAWANLTHHRTRFAAYLYTHCIEHRDTLFDTFNSIHRVEALGRCRHNTDLPPGGTTGTDEWPSTPALYSRYKFVLCVENAQVAGYITEKIVTAMMGGAIPVYLGAPDIGWHFNPRAFVDVGRFDSLSSAAEYVAWLHANDTAYLEMLAQPWFREEGGGMGGVGVGWSPWLVNSTENLFVRQMGQLVATLMHPQYAFYDHTPVQYWQNIAKWGDKGGG